LSRERGMFQAQGGVGGESSPNRPDLETIGSADF